MEKANGNSHGQPQRKSQQLCRLFNKPGGCRFGSTCKFLHATHTADSSWPKSITVTERGKDNSSRGRTTNRDVKRDGLIQWRYAIPLNPIQAQPLGARLSQFFQTASNLVDIDSGIMQDVIIALHSEGGFVRLKELMERDFESMSDTLKVKIVMDQIVPFFRIITHVNVATSIMLEDKVGSIYNFLYGRQGERAAKVFNLIVGVLTDVKQQELWSVAVLEPILAVFSSMIDINSHALVNESLPATAELLFGICNSLDQTIVVQLQRLIQKIGRRLRIGHALQSTSTQTRSNGPRATFVLPQDPPGSLSLNGPRHDNDHADINDIEILPTYAEIKSTRPPYLPSRDPTQIHLSGVKGLLDRQFRLLREDTVGQLRDAIGAELELGQVSAHNAARIFTYDNLVIMGASFSRWKGLQLLVRIDQLQHLRSSPVHVRREWWEFTNRLRLEALVCIIGQQDSITFCTVSELSHASGAKSENNEEDPSRNNNVYNDPNYCYFQLQLVSPTTSTISKLLKQLNIHNLVRRLVEFPGVLLPSFQPTLEALKKMSLRNELPFAELLVADEGSSPDAAGLRPPLYATKPRFEFELEHVMEDKSKLKYAINRPFDSDAFKLNSQLDDAQAEALIHCLSRSLALIQGPPGTGKSFTGVALIKVLLAVKQKARLGPILCVCYTNHALDQLLEHLVYHGVEQIIRIGSRSKSEVLEKCNLRAVVQNMPMTGPEKKMRYDIVQELATEEEQIKDLLQSLQQPGSKHTVKAYLESHYPDHHDQLFGRDDVGLDEEGYQKVHYSSGDEIQAWLRGPAIEDFQNNRGRSLRALRHENLMLMNSNERRRLYDFWLTNIQQTLEEKLIIAVKNHECKKKELDGIRNEQSLRCLQEANIIGVTTTGLARQLDLLRNVQSKVLVCEEAGEVLEAHILTALLPSLEHCILIGDHLQLPPKAQNYDLSRENPRGEQYSLDVSLFERLVVPENPQQALPFSILETQRRMHPSISKLIRSTLYPELKDSSHVESYPPVAGMKKRLFWFDHREPEAGSDSSRLTTTSHSNDFEIEMIVALVTHLVRQGVYAANEVAVLTPYLGQLHKIRKVFRQQFEITMNERDVEELQKQGIEDDSDEQYARRPAAKTALLKALAVSTIDNFQGEEAKVVVISLVRSNSQNKCGFLRTSNRINVLLSRAKHGMYIIGNSETSGHVKMWQDVIAMLQQEGNFGPQLELECPRHPDIPILVSKPDDFIVLSPEGGCDKKCDRRLNCGHHDQSKCHSETLHNAVKCLEPCPRQLKGCDHGCTRLCGEKCVTECKVTLTDLHAKLECGHIKSKLTCWQSRNLSAVRCRTVVEKIITGCGHKLKLECWIDTNSGSYKCGAKCGKTLECGHACQQLCHECTQTHRGVVIKQQHGKCQQICGRKFNTCRHYCKDQCHGDTPCECTAVCDNFCEHSKCGKKCNEPCAPCASMTCTSGGCPHTEEPCSMPCAAPCDWLPCSRRCEKFLVCGHRCPTICGEVCPPPQFCQICADQNVKDIVVDLITLSTYAEVDLEEDPCVIPACGHILTATSMDGQMAMSEHYLIEENAITGIKDHSIPFSMDEMKACCTCRGSLRNIARYGRIVRRSLLDESTKKFIRWAGLQTLSLTQALFHEQKKLTDTLEKAQVLPRTKDSKVKIGGPQLQQLNVIKKEVPSRYKSPILLRKRVLTHLQEVEIDEQPFKRVWDLVQHAKRTRNEVGHMHYETGVLQTREAIQLSSLLLRCDLMILSDFFTVMKDIEMSVDLSQQLRDCETLVEKAVQAEQPLHAVEGHMFYAQFCAAQRQYVHAEKIDEMMKQARQHIEEARTLCTRYPGSTNRVVDELQKVETMLRDSTFYAPMLDDEWKTVMAAMSTELRGTGHWYTCENGHPFTIGECGMAMELAKCPQCDAAIGGNNHVAAAGVRHAGDLERRFGRMNL